MSARQQFKSIPKDQQLRQMQRDLRFYPCTNQNPAVLSPEQVDGYNQKGYILRIPVLDPDEVVEQRAFFDKILDQVVAAGGSSYSIHSAHMKYGKVYDLLTHPAIVALVQDLLGGDIVGMATHYFCKMPGDDKIVAWHQDASYWPLTPSKTVTVWLAIDAADVENGCMRFIGGSHLHGHLDYRPSGTVENNVLTQTVEGAEGLGEAVDVELEAGQISMHSDMLLHSSNPNPSSRRRCGLTMRYCTPDVRALPGYGWEEEGVLISGKDPAGHWSNPPRPQEDFVVRADNLTELAAIAERSG